MSSDGNIQSGGFVFGLPGFLAQAWQLQRLFEILDDRRLVAANGNTLTDLIDEHRIISTNSGSEVWLKIKPESTYSSLSTSLPESPEQTR